MSILELKERMWLSVKAASPDLVKWRSRICSCLLED